MHAAIKAIIGLILVIVGVGLFVNSAVEPPFMPELKTFWLDNFKIVVTGVIPAFLILIGLFIVWLEFDELKAQKEIKQEKKEEKK